MCGIAGLIHRDGATGVGKEMTAMLLSLRHRGPDSTGFAIYGVSAPDYYVMRLKLAEQEDLGKDYHILDKIKKRKAEVDTKLEELGAVTVKAAEVTPYAFRYQLRYAGDTRKLATEIEQIEGAEVRADQGSRRRGPCLRSIRAGRLQGHARHRPYADGDRVGR